MDAGSTTSAVPGDGSFVTTQRFLIVGASGFIGRRLYAALGPDRATATFLTHEIAGGIRFDPLSTRLSDAVLRRAGRFSHAFILYSMTNIDACASDPELAYRINVESPKQVVADLVEHGIVPVFASSDAVLDGAHGPYAEDAPLCPILTYGRHKAEMESFMRTLGHPWLAVRLAKVLDCRPGSADMLDGWIGQIDAGQRIRCADDQVFSPIDVADVVHGLIALCERRCAGLFNLCGPDRLRRIDLLQLLIDAVARYRPIRPDIERCSLRDFDFLEARPLDTSMRADKLRHALGWRAADMIRICERAAQLRYASGHSDAAARPAA